MAIRFTSFEAYKAVMADKQSGAVSAQATFLGVFFWLPDSDGLLLT